MKYLLGLVFACGLVGAARAAQPVVALLPGCGNVDAALILGARGQLVRALGTALNVVDMDRPPQEPLPPVADVMRLGQLLRAPTVLVFRVQRNGPQTTVFVFGFATATGAPLLAFQRSTTQGPEALPEMVTQLARAILLKLTGAEPPASPSLPGGAVGVVLPPLPAAPTCVPPASGTPRNQNGIGAALGFILPVGTAGPTPAVMASVAVGLSADRMRYLFDVVFEYGAGDDAHLTSLGAGLYLPFDENQSTYYLGAQLKMTHWRLGGQGQQGLMAMPVLGYLMNRFETVRLRIEAGYLLGLVPREKAADRLFPGSGAERLTHGGHVSMGVWF